MMLPWTKRRFGHSHHESHQGAGSILRDVVFGANDGLVSNVSLVAGVAGASSDPNNILLAGIAGVVAGAISMGLGAYISTKSEREFRLSEELREWWEVENMPLEETAEIREIFAAKGIHGDTLDDLVDQITRDKDLWVRTMMREELGFSDEPPKPMISGFVMAIAFAFAASLPVLPYLFWGGNQALVISISLTGFGLFSLGMWRAHVTAGNMWKRGLEIVGLAVIAVMIAHLIGRLIGVTIV